MKLIKSLSHWPARRKLVLGIGVVVLGALVAGGAYYYYAYAAKQKEEFAGRGGNKTPVQIAMAKSEDVAVYLTALGSVTPVGTVTVRSRVDGQLMRVLFREGQTVKAGDLLAEIDPRPFQVQLTQAEGQMARDQALLANAQIDLERYRTLFAQDSVAKQQLDTQQALVKQYEGAVKVDQGVVDNARLQLSYTRITAPVGGRLGLRQVDVGNMVRQSDTNGLVVIAQMRPMTVLFAIPEGSLPAVLKGLTGTAPLPAEAYDRDGKNKLASGSLLSVDNLIDPTTGTVKLRASFGNEDDALFPNQFVNVKLRVEMRHDATVIPQAAVQRGTPGTFVYVVKTSEKVNEKTDEPANEKANEKTANESTNEKAANEKSSGKTSTVSIRPILLGPVSGEQVVIERGLEPGEQLVVDGADKLREGAAIEAIVPVSAQEAQRPRRAAGERRERGEQKGGRERRRQSES